MLKKKTCSRAHTPPQAEEKIYFRSLMLDYQRLPHSPRCSFAPVVPFCLSSPIGNDVAIKNSHPFRMAVM